MAGKISLNYVPTASGMRWCVRRRENGKDKKSFHRTKDLAEAEIASLREQIKSSGELWISLPAADRNQLMLIYREAKERGIDLRSLMPTDVNASVNRTALKEVIKELKLSKTNRGASEGYVKNLGIVLNQFARGREFLNIKRISTIDIEAYLDTKSLAYRATVRGKLSTLFNFAVRRGYRLDNPCMRLEPVKVPYKPPEILSSAQFKVAVEWLVENNPRGLAWFALSTLCGLRPEEAEKTTESNINFDEGYIKVEAQTTKVRQRRVVYPKIEAMLFLKWAIKNGGSLPLPKNTRRNLISGRKPKRKGLRDALGFATWPKDITRHTAASYWLAGGETAAMVSRMLGNSERILERAYRALVTRAEANEFWEMVTNLSKE